MERVTSTSNQESLKDEGQNDTLTRDIFNDRAFVEGDGPKEVTEGEERKQTSKRYVVNFSGYGERDDINNTFNDF